jgi:hypothetical protein
MIDAAPTVPIEIMYQASHIIRASWLTIDFKRRSEVGSTAFPFEHANVNLREPKHLPKS